MGGKICHKKLNPVDQQLLKSSHKSKMSDSSLYRTGLKSDSGVKFINNKDFMIKRKIGKGSYGQVFLVEHRKSSKNYAMKILEKSHIKQSDLVENSKVERIILSQISYPFVVDLHYSFQTKRRLYLVTEYVPGGDLFNLMQKLKSFQYEQIRLYLAEIVLSLDHLHHMKCIYRDLKPENILVGEDGHIKIIDFGLSKMFFDKKNSERADSICGTAEYMAPEVIVQDDYDANVDWFSLGVIAYFFFAGHPAFNCRSKPLEVSIKRKLPIFNNKIFNQCSIDLISSLLAYNPKERLGYKGVDEIKSHNFFDGLDWSSIEKKQITPIYVPANQRETMISGEDSMMTSAVEDLEQSQIVISTPKKKQTYDGFTYIKDYNEAIKN